MLDTVIAFNSRRAGRPSISDRSLLLVPWRRIYRVNEAPE